MVFRICTDILTNNLSESKANISLDSCNKMGGKTKGT